MSCRVKKNKEGRVIDVLTPEGKSSRAFNKVRGIPFIGETDTSMNMFKNIYADSVEKMYDNVNDKKFIFEDTKEPRIYFKDNKGNIREDMEQSIIDGNGGQFRVGILNPSNSKFIEIGSFNTKSSAVSSTISSGIEQGLISTERVTTEDGFVRLSGKSEFNKNRVGTARMFKEYFENTTGIPVKVYEDGTIEIKQEPNYTTLIDEDGNSEVVRDEDVREKLKEKQYANKADAIMSYSDLMGERFPKEKRNVKRVATEKELLGRVNIFLNRLGFTSITMDEYKKSYADRYGVDPDVNALVDLSEKVVAIGEGQAQFDDTIEEVSHLAVASYKNQGGIQDALAEVSDTKEYNEWSEQYREKYADEFTNDKGEVDSISLEDKVREEILGKIIANRVKEDSFQEQSVFKNIWDKFLNYIRSKITGSHRRVLDRIVEDVSSNILKGNTSVFNSSNLKGRFYSLEKDNNSTTKALKEIERSINSIAEVALRNKNSKARGSKVNLGQLANSLTDYQKVSSINKINKAVISNLKELGYLSDTGELSAVDFTRLKALKEIYTKTKKLFKDELESVVEVESKKIAIQETRNIENINEQISKIEDEFGDINERIFAKIIEREIDEGGLTQAESEKLLDNLNGVHRDITQLASMFGVLSESSVPELALLSKLTHKIKIRTQQKSAKVLKDVLDLAEKKGWTKKQIQQAILQRDKDGKLTGYFINALDNAQYEKDKNEARVENIAELLNIDKEEAIKLYKLKSTEDIFGENIDSFNEYTKRARDWIKDNTEKFLKDEYYEDKQKTYKRANVAEESIENFSSLRRESGEIQRRANPKGNKVDKSEWSETDRRLFNEKIEQQKIKASPVDALGNIREGLKLSKYKDLTFEEKDKFNKRIEGVKDFLEENPDTRVVTLEEGVDLESLSSESRYSLDMSNMNLVKRSDFSGGQNNGFSEDFIKKVMEFRRNGDDDGLLNFLNSNSSIVFNDNYYEGLKGNLTFEQRVEDNIESIKDEDLKDEIRAHLENYKQLSNEKNEVLKSYKDIDNNLETNSFNIDSVMRSEFIQKEDSIKEIRGVITRLFGSNNIDLFEEQSTPLDRTYSESFKKEAGDAGYKVEDDNGEVQYGNLVDFAKEVLKHSSRADRIVRFREYVLERLKSPGYYPSREGNEKLLAAFKEKNGELYKEAIDRAKNGDFNGAADILVSDYVVSQLPSYYLRADIDESREIKDNISEMSDSALVEALRKGSSIGNQISLKPDFAWSEMADDSNYVNKTYKSEYGGEMPKFSKYANEDYFSKFSISKSEFTNSGDVGLENFKARSNTNEFEYLQKMIEIKKLSDEKYNYTGNVYLAVQKSTTNIQKLRSSTKSGGIKSGVRDYLKDIVYDRMDEKTYGEQITGGVSGLSSVRTIPRFFRAKLEDPNSISQDTLSASLLDYIMASEFESRTELADQFHAVIHKIENTEFTSSNDVFSKTGITRKGEASKAYKRAVEQIEFALYGVKQSVRLEYNVMGKTIDFTRVLNRFRKWSVFSNLAFNPFIALTSYTTSKYSDVIDRIVGDIYSNDAKNKANRVVNKDVADMLTNVGKVNNKSKAYAIAEFLGVETNLERIEDSGASRFMRVVKSSPYGLDRMTDTPIRIRLMYAMLYDHRVVKYTDEKGNDIYKVKNWDAFKKYMAEQGVTDKDRIKSIWKSKTSLFDYIENDKGAAKIKEDFYKMFSKEQAIDIFESVGAKTIQQYQRVSATMSMPDRTTAQRHAFFNTIMQHKSWFPILTSKMLKHRGHNFITGRTEEGYLRTGLEFMGGLISNIKTPVKFVREWMSGAEDFQKKNMKRVLAETIGYAAVVSIMLALLAGGDDDDESDFHALSSIIAMRTLREVKSGNFMGLYSSTLGILKNPVTTLNTLTNNLSVVSSAFNFSSDEYSDKLIERFVKATPIKRLNDIRDLEGYKQKFLFYNKGTVGETEWAN